MTTVPQDQDPFSPNANPENLSIQNPDVLEAQPIISSETAITPDPLATPNSVITDTVLEAPQKRFSIKWILVTVFCVLLALLFIVILILFNNANPQLSQSYPNPTPTQTPLASSEPTSSPSATPTSQPSTQPSPSLQPTPTPSPSPLPSPSPTPIPKPSEITISVYKDDNKNSILDNGEKPLNGMVRVVRIVNQTSERVTTLPVDGKYAVSLTPGSYSLQPLQYTDYNPPPNKIILVNGDGKAQTYFLGYQPTVSQGGIRVYVYDDKNENNVRDDGEELIHYQTARVTELANSSNSSRYAVPPDGMDIFPLSYGTYYVVLDPQDEAWRASYKVTGAGENVNVQSSGTTTVYLGAKKN